MKITDYLKNNTVFLDGGTGTLLQAAGLPTGELPERWNITHPDVIYGIHKSYFDSGSNIVCTNTFGANILKFSKTELEEIIGAAVKNARAAMNDSGTKRPKWIALDIGPTGRMLKPLGDLDFEDAVAVFAETVKIGARCGVDLIFIETMSDSYETKAALLAAKENCNLPVFVSNAYGADGKLMTGATPAAMVALLEGMGADAIGVNCSLGPRALSSVVEEYLKYASVPLILKPNAGLPRVTDGHSEYEMTPEAFVGEIKPLVEKGVRIVGGCCGTTPEFISAIVDGLKAVLPKEIEKKNHTLASSYTHAVEFGERVVLIGERINPTGKPRFKQAIKEGDIGYVLKEGIAEEESGAHILDVNVGLPGVDEVKMLTRVVCELQAVTDLPLQIDSADPVAIESALRRYNGKAMINSVNGKVESMNAIFPLAKKYGGLVVALTLDEDGIPKSAHDRVKIAEKILIEAERWGIDKKDIIFDPLCLAVSADKDAAAETLSAVRIIREQLGAHTSLGISNVSFGLPNRDLLNSTFFTMALTSGLSAAIMNPHSSEMMKAYHGYTALSGGDCGFDNYIDFASCVCSAQKTEKQATKPKEDSSSLEWAIFKGLKEQAAELTRQSLLKAEPLSIVNNEIIPALNRVGEGFEKKTVYLPSLLMSAEAAGAAFEVIKTAMPADKTARKGKIVIATVKGDIHDIGKNIVRLILENYGYEVIDLGRDVEPRKIADEVIRTGADILGLSALMTTTLPAMASTVELVRSEAPLCKIMVGGAVLTAEYAEKIGADFYASDAMEAVRFAEKVNKT